MSQMQAIDTIQSELDILNTGQQKMIKAAEDLTDLLYIKEKTVIKDGKPEIVKTDVFHEHVDFHKKFSLFVNSLITITPYIPNKNLPTGQFPFNQPPTQTETGELAEALEKKHEISLTRVLALAIVDVPILFMAAMFIIPWVIAIIIAISFALLLFSPEVFPALVATIKALMMSAEEEDENKLWINPTEWITKEAQICSDKYDDVYLLIVTQNVPIEQLGDEYKNKNIIEFNRLEQEKRLFPTECLTFVRKVTVFCNYAIQERKAFLISAMQPQPTPQPPTVPVLVHTNQ